MEQIKPVGKVIGILGGSFNPPHVAHVLVCQFALCCWPLDSIIVIPSFIHPFEKELEPFSHRFRMTELAFANLVPRVEISRIEEEMGGVSFTIDTIQELKRRLPDAALRLIVGSDIVPEMGKWKDIDTVRREAPPLVVPRLDASKGASVRKDGFYLPDLSSTKIREQLHNGNDPGVSVPWRVMDYIRFNGLYGLTKTL